MPDCTIIVGITRQSQQVLGILQCWGNENESEAMKESVLEHLRETAATLPEGENKKLYEQAAFLYETAASLREAYEEAIQKLDGGGSNGRKEYWPSGKWQSTVWRNAEGQLHRVDGPAFERSDGHAEWWEKGKRHRENGPAMEYAGGSKFWYLNGKYHREAGPAVEWADGMKKWFLNGEWQRTEYYNEEGQLHREDGPAAVVWADGTKHWYLNDKRHREDGPAIEWDGAKEWWAIGLQHREDGPAIERQDGSEEWWLNGKRQRAE